MTRSSKLINRLLARPKDFTYDELRKLMISLSYIEYSKGMTSGSRVAFYNKETKFILRLHKPHPRNELKEYQSDILSPPKRWELLGKYKPVFALLPS